MKVSSVHENSKTHELYLVDNVTVYTCYTMMNKRNISEFRTDAVEIIALVDLGSCQLRKLVSSAKDDVFSSVGGCTS